MNNSKKFINDQVNHFHLFSLKNCKCSLPLYRLYTTITRERNTLAFVQMTYRLSLPPQGRVAGLGNFPR
jgi:hypothetical protein